MVEAGTLVDKLIQHEVVETFSEEVPGVPWPVESDEEVRPVDFGRLKNRDFPRIEHPGLIELERDLGQLLESQPEHVQDPLDDEVRENGVFDRCAWYRPIHFYGHSWGIFIRERCVIRLARRTASFLGPWVLTRMSRTELVLELVSAATYAFFLHEHFHHKVEAFGIRLWVAEDQPRYVPYKRTVYQPTWRTDDNIEEALANADMRRRFSNPPYSNLEAPVRDAIRAALDWMFARSPGGYRRAPDYRGEAFKPGVWRLQTQIQEATLAPSQDPTRWELATHSMRSLRRVDDRIWAVVPAGRRSFLP